MPTRQSLSRRRLLTALGYSFLAPGVIASAARAQGLPSVRVGTLAIDEGAAVFLCQGSAALLAGWHRRGHPTDAERAWACLCA